MKPTWMLPGLLFIGCVADPTDDPADKPDAGASADAGATADAGTEPRSLTSLFVPGACPAQDDLSSIDLSVVLGLDGEATGALPDARVGGQTLATVLTPERFVFSRVPEDPAGSLPGVLTGEEAFDVGLTVESVEFRPSGGDQRRDKARLVLLMVDSSGSLRGRDAATGEVDDRKASDRDDMRFAFLKRVIDSLPSDHYISLISFNNEVPNIDPAAEPTRNHAIIESGLDDLEQAERGATPLARALTDGKAAIIDSNTDLNPVVVLLTDGVEGGDPTDDAERSQLRAAVDAYEAAQVPVMVVQLQVPEQADTPRGRDPLLVELACRTGGEHFFVEAPEEFIASEGTLAQALLHRLAGAWILRTRVDVGGASLRSGSYFLSTVLGVDIGDDQGGVRLAGPADPAQPFLDTRLWLTKP